MTARLGDLLAIGRRVDLNDLLAAPGLTNPSVMMGADGRAFHLVLKKNHYDRRVVWQTDDRRWDTILGPEGEFGIEHVHARLTPDLTLAAAEALAMPRLSLGTLRFDAADDVRLVEWNGKLWLFGSCLSVRRRHEAQAWKVSGVTTRMFLSPLVQEKGAAAVLPAFFNATDMDKNWVTHERSNGPLLLGIDLNRGIWIALDRPPQQPVAMPRHDLRWQGGWSGSSNLVDTGNGFVAVMHRAITMHPSVYHHMFVICDQRFRVLRRSEPFTFEGEAVEFCIGLTRHAARRELVLSYGVWDDQARLLTLDEDAVMALCRHPVAEPRELYSVS